MTVTNLPRKPGAPKSSRLEIAKPKIVEVLLDPAGRAKLVEHVVDTSRQWTSRGDRVEYWLALVENWREIARREGTERPLIDQALDLLSRDVKAENERRHQVCLTAARIDPPLFGFEAVEPGKVLLFPGDKPFDPDELLLPERFK